MNAPRPIADQLRTLIQGELKRGLSLNAIAQKADIKQSVLWRFMNEPDKDLKVSTAERLAAALGVNLKIVR